MPSIGRQFGMGEGVPRKDLALAALGVENNLPLAKGPCLPAGREPEGVLDEIALSEVEQHEAEKSEGEVWGRDDLVKWARTVGSNFSEVWVDDMFAIQDDGRLTYDGPMLVLSETTKEVPPGLIIGTLDLSNTDIMSIPPNALIEHLLIRADQDSLKQIAVERGITLHEFRY